MGQDGISIVVSQGLTSVFQGSSYPAHTHSFSHALHSSQVSFVSVPSLQGLCSKACAQKQFMSLAKEVQFKLVIGHLKLPVFSSP